MPIFVPVVKSVIWIVGLTNDYQSYFATEDEYHERGYDSCSSLSGRHGVERIHRTMEKALS